MLGQIYKISKTPNSEIPIALFAAVARERRKQFHNGHVCVTLPVSWPPGACPATSSILQPQPMSQCSMVHQNSLGLNKSGKAMSSHESKFSFSWWCMDVVGLLLEDIVMGCRALMSASSVTRCQKTLSGAGNFLLAGDAWFSAYSREIWATIIRKQTLYLPLPW